MKIFIIIASIFIVTILTILITIIVRQAKGIRILNKDYLSKDKAIQSYLQIITNKEEENKILVAENQKLIVESKNLFLNLESLQDEIDSYDETEYSLEETASKQDIKDFSKEVLAAQLKESITSDLLETLTESFKEHIIFEEDSNQGNLEITGKIKIITKFN